MKTFLILMASILQINFSSIESKPHLTNVFMNHARWNYQNGFETNQMTDTFPIESRTYRDSQGDSGLRLTFEDFPESKTRKYSLFNLVQETKSSHFSKIGDKNFKLFSNFLH